MKVNVDKLVRKAAEFSNSFKDNKGKAGGKFSEVKSSFLNHGSHGDDEDSEFSEEEVAEKGSKMLTVMDWAFDKANGDIPGFGTSAEMSQKYLDKYGTPASAVDHLAKWQITSAATAGFVTGLGGLATMPLTLPANVAGVMAVQLRMIGAIAQMGGATIQSEEVKTGMYLCLLGSQAGNVLSKTASQFAVKFTTASLKKLPGAVLTKINQQVGFRLFTKFGSKGLVNINRLIPVLGGVVGGSVDAFSTYAMAKAAKAMFLGDIIEFEDQEKKQVEINKLLINMALVDGIPDDSGRNYLKEMVSRSGLSQDSVNKLYLMIDKGHGLDVDYKLLANDSLLQSILISRIMEVAKRDGLISVGEKMYLITVCKELSLSEEYMKEIMCNLG